MPAFKISCQNNFTILYRNLTLACNLKITVAQVYTSLCYGDRTIVGDLELSTAAEVYAALCYGNGTAIFDLELSAAKIKSVRTEINACIGTAHRPDKISRALYAALMESGKSVRKITDGKSCRPHIFELTVSVFI